MYGAIITVIDADLEDIREKDDDEENADCGPYCVIRGGLATAYTPIRGYGGPFTDYNNLYGLSTIYNPGTFFSDLLDEITRTKIPGNSQLSYASNIDLEIAVAAVNAGYRLEFTPTSGDKNRYHSTLTLFDGSDMMHDLPEDVVVALQTAFAIHEKITNPGKR